MEKQNGNRQLDVIVNEVVSEAHLNRALLLPEEIDYIRQHALNKPLGVIHIWALGGWCRSIGGKVVGISHRRASS